MLGLPVTYYVFTDLPEKMPDIKLAPQRSIKVIKVERHSRWQDVSMMRMKTISEVIESDIRHHCTHVFCFDVDQVFTGRFGSEAVGDSVALLHAYFYRLPRNLYTYDRNPKSKAYMEVGDFYYHAAVFGGSWKWVKALTEACYQGIMEDKKNKVEALWHDESHLNKYMWLHKPSRVLSPEYCWDPNIGNRSEIRVTRLQWAPKHYEALRTEWRVVELRWKKHLFYWMNCRCCDNNFGALIEGHNDLQEGQQPTANKFSANHRRAIASTYNTAVT